MTFLVVWWYCETQYQTSGVKGDWGCSADSWIEKAARLQFERENWPDADIAVTIADMQQFGDWELVSVTREI